MEPKGQMRKREMTELFAQSRPGLKVFHDGMGLFALQGVDDEDHDVPVGGIRHAADHGLDGREIAHDQVRDVGLPLGLDVQHGRGHHRRHAETGHAVPAFQPSVHSEHEREHAAPRGRVPAGASPVREKRPVSIQGRLPFRQDAGFQIGTNREGEHRGHDPAPETTGQQKEGQCVPEEQHGKAHGNGAAKCREGKWKRRLVGNVGLDGQRNLHQQGQRQRHAQHRREKGAPTFFPVAAGEKPREDQEEAFQSRKSRSDCFRSKVHPLETGGGKSESVFALFQSRTRIAEGKEFPFLQIDALHGIRIRIPGQPKSQIFPFHALTQVKPPNAAICPVPVILAQHCASTRHDANGFCVVPPHIHLDLIGHPAERDHPQGHKCAKVGNKKVPRDFHG